jgi:5-bromo-4-chloroindolyl phosphate hydrolysis protein
MFFNKALPILYLIVLALILIELFEFWGLATILMLFLIITLVQKIHIEAKIKETDRTRKNTIDLVTEKLDIFASRIGEIGYNLDKHVYALENRINEARHSYEVEQDRNYRELARKIFDVENRLNDVKKTLGAAFGSLDERVRKFEKEEEWSG